MRAGDQVVIRGGNYSDLGFDGAWLRFRDAAQCGTPSAFIHITGFPGEDAHYSTPAGKKGGIHGAESAVAATVGKCIAISNLRIDVSGQASSDAAPINMQYSTADWWVTNNELGPWPVSGVSAARAAGIAGSGARMRLRGNHIHHIAGTSALENHGIYNDNLSDDFEIAYNWIHDITGGSLIQWYDSVGVGPCFKNQNVHHNWLEVSGKYGLNVAQGMVSGRIWRNVIIGAKLSGLRFDIEGSESRGMALTVDENVFFDNDRVFSGSGNGQVLNTGGSGGPTGTIKVERNKFGAGPSTYSGSIPWEDAGVSSSWLTMAGNEFYSAGRTWSAPSKDATAKIIASTMPTALLSIVL